MVVGAQITGLEPFGDLSTARRQRWNGADESVIIFAVRMRFLAIGLIAGLLAACTSSGADPKPSPSPSPVRPTSSVAPSTSAPSPSRTGPLTTGPNVRPGEKPPIFPSEAKRRTAAGAMAFAGYYFKVLDWAIATNDDYPVRQVAERSCGACQKAYAALNLLRTHGEREVGGRIRILGAKLETTRYRMTYDYAVRIVYREEAVEIIAANGLTRTSSPPVVRSASLVFVRWTDGAWHVADVTTT